MADISDQDDFGDIEDEDFLAVTIDVEKASTASVSRDHGDAQSPPPLSPYRFTFGRHYGKTIDQVPEGYLHWIMCEKAHHSHPDLKAAIDAKIRASITTSGSATIKPTTPAGKPYRLDFGLFANKTLREVPLEYIRSLTRLKVHESRRDLMGALTELAYSNDDASHSPTKEAPIKDWKALLAVEPDKRFFDWYFKTPLWITSGDASNFFGVNARDLSAAGLRPLTGRRWSLFELYTFARHQTSLHKADQCLAAFLEKNSDREEEIFDMLGLRNGECCSGYQ